MLCINNADLNHLNLYGMYIYKINLAIATKSIILLLYFATVTLLFFTYYYFAILYNNEAIKY